MEYARRLNYLFFHVLIIFAGDDVRFNIEEVHMAPVILKKFLRELPEPLLTFELYDGILDACCKFLFSNIRI